MSLLKNILFKSLKTLWAVFATAVVLLAVIISLLKLTLPYAEDYKKDIEQFLLTNYNADIKIGSIGASWQELGPSIILSDVTLSATQETPLDLSIIETKVNIDFWKSLKEQRLVTSSFLLSGINTYINSDVFFKVRPQSQGSQLFEGLSHLFLTQVQQFQVINSTIIVQHQDGQNQTFQIDNLAWVNDGNRHRGQGEVFIDGFSDNSLVMRMDLYGQRRNEIFGQIYLEANQVDITPWLTQVVGEHVSVESTEGNFRIWSDVSDGLVKRILMDVNNTGVRWKKQDENKYLFIDKALLKWKQTKENWALVANQIKLKTESQQPEPFNLTFTQNNNQLNLLAADVDLNAITQLFSLFSATKETSILADTAVNGVVSSLHVVWPETKPIMAKIKIKDFSFLPHYVPNQAYVGLSGMELSGAWIGDRGKFSLTGKNGQLETKDTFAKPISYQSLNIETSLKLVDGDLNVKVPKLSLKNEDINLNLTAKYTQVKPVDGWHINNKHLSLYAEIEGPKQGEIPNYLPKYLIGSETHDYLLRSIQQGQGALTQVILDGSPTDMPFEKGEGTFVVKAQLKNLLFEFDESWPAIKDFNAVLTVDKLGLGIAGESGQIGPLTIDNDVDAFIDLGARSSILSLDINPPNLAFSQFHELIETSPLKNIIGNVFEFVKLQGSGKTKVHLDIPLSDDLDEYGSVPTTKASGSVVTNSANLKMPSLNIEFDQLASVIHFSNAAFSINKANGVWNGLPISFDVTGDQYGEDYKIDGQMSATWNNNQVAKNVSQSLSQYLMGDMEAGLTVSVNLEDNNDFQYFVDAQIDLLNAGYNITGPLKNKQGSPSALEISVIGDQDINDVFVDLDDKVHFFGEVPSLTGTMDRAILVIGETTQPVVNLLPASGFNLDINLPKVEFEPTLSFVLDLIDSLPESDVTKKSFLESPQRITGQFGELEILGQSWTDVSLNAKPAGYDWLFEVNSKQVSAKVTVPEDLVKTGLKINADFLKIVNVVPDKGAEENKSKTPSMTNSAELISKIPSIHFICAICTYNDKPLGKITLDTFTRDNSLFIEKAEMEYQRSRVSLAGIWTGDKKAGKTTLTGDVYSRNLGNWMQDWGFNTGVKQSDLKTKLSLSWLGAPQDFGFDSLNGELSFEMGEGYLSEVSDQGARIFSLFSLNSLYRKLKFDFKDVFQKGLFYNDIKGSLVIKDGLAHSEDIRMDGVAGNMNMRGYTNLSANTLDYDVTFKPKITSSIPVIAAWLAPGTAGLSFLAGIAIDKIIEKADVVSEVRLKITGDLSDPKVQEVKRFTKTIDIPQSKQTKPEAPSADQPNSDNPQQPKKPSVEEPNSEKPVSKKTASEKPIEVL